ncbi:SET domain-containing protein 4-like [Ptychodera flava]|uniref:SET domain-containing protein 4-like n=1 Tax=Ptychodera flava TaxID=63121 RepID=UPI00396A451C
MGRGRTQRHRRRKHNFSRSLGSDSSFINLLKWMRRNGFHGTFLNPANFRDTGRGLMASNAIRSGDLLISLPENLLITTDTVMKSYLRELIIRNFPRLSPEQVLCTFLICERCRGRLSFWRYYILSLPKDFTTPVYFQDAELCLLPGTIRTRAFSEKEKIVEAYNQLEHFFSNVEAAFPEFRGLFTFDSFRWAWCVVNTRSVYMKREKSVHLSEDVDHYALAPLLDLLNHANSVEVQAAFNMTTKCYEIHTLTPCKKHSQVFIHYGPHDNVKLFLEYGFVLPKNDQNFVEIPFSKILKSMHELCRSKQDRSFLDWKVSFLESMDSLTKLTCSLDGVSWKLMTVMQILSMEQGERSAWKSILLGQSACSDRCAKMAAVSLKAILLNELEILKALPKVPEPVQEIYHGHIIKQLRNEQQEILERSVELLESG